MTYKKKGLESLHVIVIVIVALGVALILFKTLLSKESGVTGKVVQGEQTVFSENLKLVVNESGTYEWKVNNPGSIKSLKATGAVSPNGSAKVYIEKQGKRTLLFDSTKQLFDIDISVLPEYKKAFVGDEILVQIIMFNLRGFGSGNVNARYFIRDGKGNIVATQEETIFVETQAKFVRKLTIPGEIKPGTYLASVEVLSNKTAVGAGSDTFEIKPKYEDTYPPELKYYTYILAALVGIAIITVLSVIVFRNMTMKKKIIEITEKESSDKLNKMDAELKALEEAYSSKYLSEDSYMKDKTRIEGEITRLKRK